MNILNYKSKLLSKNYKGWVDNYINKKEVYPKIMELDPTSSCMFSCPDCINSNLVNKKNSFSNKELKRIINEFSSIGGKGIIFIGGGEPLAHPYFGEALKLCAEKNIRVGITTNGFLIDRYVDEIAKNSDWIRVSMDAGTETTFLKVRPNKFPNSFEKILNNMYKLSKVKTGILGYSFLLVENKEFTNIHDLYKAAEIAREIGCDYFEYKPMVDPHHFLYEYSKEFIEELDSIVPKLKDLQTEKFKIVTPRSMNMYNKESLEQPKEYDSCPVANLRTLVTPYGTYPCPYKRGFKEFNMGKANDGLLKMLNGKQRKEVLEKLNPIEHCKFYCIRHEINNFLNGLERGALDIDELEFQENNDVFV